MIRTTQPAPIAPVSAHPVRANRWRRGVVIAAAALALALPACSTWQVHVTSTPVASSTARHTFAFGEAETPPQGYQPPARAALALRRLQDAATSCLAARGYQPVAAGSADLVVRFAVGVHVDTRVAAEPGGTSAGDSTIRTETEGDWTLEIFDRASGQRVLSGRAHGDLDPADASTTSMQHAIERILVAFPRSGA